MLATIKPIVDTKLMVTMCLQFPKSIKIYPFSRQTNFGNFLNSEIICMDLKKSTHRSNLIFCWQFLNWYQRSGVWREITATLTAARDFFGRVEECEQALSDHWWPRGIDVCLRAVCLLASGSLSRPSFSFIIAQPAINSCACNSYHALQKLQFVLLSRGDAAAVA